MITKSFDEMKYINRGRDDEWNSFVDKLVIRLNEMKYYIGKYLDNNYLDIRKP